MTSCAFAGIDADFSASLLREHESTAAAATDEIWHDVALRGAEPFGHYTGLGQATEGSRTDRPEAGVS